MGSSGSTRSFDFMRTVSPYKGMYYNDLSPRDKNTFLNHLISVGEIEETDRKIILEQFLRLNRSGRKMDESHLQKVERMIGEI